MERFSFPALSQQPNGEIKKKREEMELKEPTIGERRRERRSERREGELGRGE